MDEYNSEVSRAKTEFLEFLQIEGFGYEDRIRDVCSGGGTRVSISLNHLREHDLQLTRQLIQRPMDFLFPLMEAVTELARDLDPSYAKKNGDRRLQVGFEGSFGEAHVSPRGLLSHLLATLVCVDGIVTKVSVVRPKLVRSVQYCAKTKKHSVREFRDDTAVDLGLEANGRVLLPTTTAPPSRDPDGNVLDTEYGLCDYKDHQVVTIQEMPERAPHGQLPRSVDVLLDHGLVNSMKPGDRVSIAGVYRAQGSASHGAVPSTFRTILIANAVKLIGNEASLLKLLPEDVAAIRGLPEACVERGEAALDVLSRSLCPSIYGHEFIKRALILQLLGGEEKNLENGTHLRGDINLMIVGDPGTAKSQLLRSVLKHAPLAVSTTGRGSSGVGLTAAVTSDPETGERRLEAGAMVLADRGSVCIDEFDKMSEADRVAIHEVMEQQTVTIAKAGIHATLNARCSVTAAANPVYGQYDRNRRPQENIGLPDSLLSRFDLLFIVLDMLDSENDRQVAGHVLLGHCYRRNTDMAPEPLVSGPVLEDGAGGSNDADDGHDGTKIWVRNWHARGSVGITGVTREHQQILNGIFLRKFIRYAKSRVHPALTEEATEEIANAYADLRAKQDIKTLPVTARTLETLIRLSTAHAKARLSLKVERVDVEDTMRLMNFALYHDRGDAEENLLDSKALLSSQAALQTTKRQRPGSESTPLGTKERITQTIIKLVERTGQDELGFDDILEAYNATEKSPLSKEETEELLGQIEQDGLLSYADGIVQYHNTRDAEVGEIVPLQEPDMESPLAKRQRTRLGEQSKGAKELLQKTIHDLTLKTDQDGLELDEVLESYRSRGGSPLSREAAEKLLLDMEDENQVMFQDGKVFTI